MKLVLKSCKSDGNSMTVEVVDTESGRNVAAAISARTCGAPFLGHEASVKQLIGDLVEGMNAFLLSAEPEAPAEEPEAALEAPKKARK